MLKINEEAVKDPLKRLINTTGSAIELVIALPTIKIVPNILFVMCHPHPQFNGSMQNKVVTTTTKTMQQMGLTTIRFNFRGVGQSLGVYGDGVGEVEDLLAVLQFAEETYPDHEIWLGGFSFGGYIAYCGASRNDRVTQLLTIAPGVEHFDFLLQPEPKVPWVVIQGDADEIVPAEKVLALLSAVKCSYHLIKLQGVGHFFHQQLLLLKNELRLAYLPRIL